MASVIEAVETPATDLVLQEVAVNPVVVFTDEAKFSEFYERIKAEVTGKPIDLSTATGRKAVASLAFKVTKAKTALDKAGLGLTEAWRQQTNAVNAARKKITAELDGLADEVRRPLTEWEVAEDARVEKVSALIRQLQDGATVHLHETSADVGERACVLADQVLDPDVFRDRLSEAQAAKDAAISALNQAHARLTKEEADRAELERLRAEAAERAERERLEREARDKAEAERLAAERDKQAAAEAEQRRTDELRRAEERAAQAARDEAARAARAEEDAREAERQRVAAEERRKHEEALAAERRAREQAEAEARAAREREAAEAAEAERVRAEQARRDEDRAHRSKVQRAAKEAIMRAGADEPTAKTLVLAIVAGEIPNVRMVF